MLARRSLIEVLGSEQRLFLPAPIRAYAKAKLKGLSAERRQQLLASSLQALAVWFDALNDQLGTVRAREATHAGIREDANVAALVEALKMEALPEDASTKADMAHAIEALAPRYAQVMRHAGQARTGAERLEDIARWVLGHVGAGAAEANTQQSLGDLFRRTDRLKEAEEAYRLALPIFQSIDSRLGEANTLAGLGNLELSFQRPRQAFDQFRAALRIHMAVDNALGEAAAYSYLGRAAALAGNARRATALSGRAWQLASKIDERFGQMLALQALARALAQLGREEVATRAVLLAWENAAAIGDPFAGQLAQQTGLSAPPSDALSESRALLTTTLAEIDAELAAAGEDLYAPL